MAIVDPGINPAIFSTAVSVNGEANSLSGNISHPDQKIEPVKHVSETVFTRLHDLEEHGGISHLESDEERKKEILQRIRKEWEKISEKEGVYNSRFHFEPDPPLGLIIDIYC